ncbi:MAG: flagellar hook-associated protein FlgK, partial [Betaproteobacteria bacterium]|nr:flagellar hook-associated protein FlgK [Betaproteobacteria bacterium]
MSDLLTIGSSGVNAYQRALATISNNIANVSTDGYARQDVAISSGTPRLIGNNYFGTGARFDAVKRQYDAFVESNLRNSNSDLESQKPIVTYVNRLIDVMGDQSIGLTSALNLFFQSARDLSTDPASTVARSTFLRDADGLAARFRQLAGQFDSLDTETRQKVETDVGQINSLTAQLAALNKQLVKHSDVANQPSELLDQRDLLLRNLSAFTAIKTKFAQNGAVLVSVGDTIDQGVLVNGVNSRAITVQASKTDPNKLDFIIDPYGKPETIPYFTSGSVGGAVAFRDQVLMPALSSLNDIATVVTQEVNDRHRNGVDAQGNLGVDLFGYEPGKEGTAAGMLMLVQDTNRVAAAGQFRVINDPLNGGNALARVAYATPSYGGGTALAGSLGEGKSPQVGQAQLVIDRSQGVVPVGGVQVGTDNFRLSLQNASATQRIQVFTRDGRQLVGTALTSVAQAEIMQQTKGMEAGATYDATYRNKEGTDAYLDMDVFVGVRAETRVLQQFDSTTGKLLTPVREPAALAATGSVSLGSGIANGALKLNGVALNLAGTTGLNDVVAQINLQMTAANINIQATAVDGRLTLTRTNGDVTNDVRLSIGDNGNVSDLAKLGFGNTLSLYVNGAAKDDLLVFVTDTQTAAPAVQTDLTAQFDGVRGDMKQALRGGTLRVNFIASATPNQLDYTITDVTTNTVVAKRSIDSTISNPSIDYRGLHLEFSTQPKAGDKFSVDGNRDGIGNNEAMMQIVALEDKQVIPGGLTMTEAYIERVNQVGNTARQAAISQQALQVVFEQAKETRDGISGVSLDEEATNLVRYQQAYQANAKVMQIGSQLFDA